MFGAKMLIDYMLVIMKEELLIDFCELIGKHTGENMAEAVWEMLMLYALHEKVEIQVYYAYDIHI